MLTEAETGADLLATEGAIRRRLFDRGAVIYLDLPLATPATALVAGHLEDLGVSFSGIFPNSRADGDVLRMQVAQRHHRHHRRRGRRIGPREGPLGLRAERHHHCRLVAIAAQIPRFAGWGGHNGGGGNNGRLSSHHLKESLTP